MKYAASIKLDGEIVAATDSSYEDYKRLQLLCPNCKEPVFLQSSSKRILNKWFCDNLQSGLSLWETGVRCFVLDMCKIDWFKALEYIDDPSRLSPLHTKFFVAA